MNRAKFSLLNKPAVLLTLFVLAWIVFFSLGLHETLTFANIQNHRAEMISYSQRHWFSSLIEFGAAYILLTTISFPGASLLSLVAGALYGTIVGTLLVSVAATIGSIGAFLTVRHAVGGALRSRLEHKLGWIDEAVARDGLRYLFFLRLKPLVPFFLINIGMGLTKMDTWPFVWVSFIGMLPGAALYVNAGTQLAQIHDAHGLLSLPIILSLVAVGLIPMAINYFFFRQNRITE